MLEINTLSMTNMRNRHIQIHTEKFFIYFTYFLRNFMSFFAKNFFPGHFGKNSQKTNEKFCYLAVVWKIYIGVLSASVLIASFPLWHGSSIYVGETYPRIEVTNFFCKLRLTIIGIWWTQHILSHQRASGKPCNDASLILQLSTNAGSISPALEISYGKPID